MSARIYVTRQIPQTAIDLLIEAGIDVEVYPKDQVIPREELLKRVKDRDGILCILTETIDAEVFNQANRAKIFANYAVGFNNIDVHEATKRGIAITNTPGVLTDATADLAWSLILSTARRIVDSDKFLRAGKFEGWGPLFFLGQDVTERTLGVIGMGRIGRAVTERAAAFRMKILYTNRDQAQDVEEKYPYEIEQVELENLLTHSDFVTIHLPLTNQTQHFIGENQLKMMQNHAVLVNTSRGPIVDENALVTALKEGWIWGAGLDVYEHEPEVHPELMKMNNAVLVPHLGSATFETRAKMGMIAAENLIAYFEGKKPPNLVNQDIWNS